MNSNANDHLFEILLALNRLKVKFVVCGGVAAVLLGVERMTVDLDIAIDFKPENVKKFIVAMKQLGLTPRAPVQPEVLFERGRSLDSPRSIFLQSIPVLCFPPA